MKLPPNVWAFLLAVITLGFAGMTAQTTRAQVADQIYAETKCGGVSAQWRPFNSPPGDLEPLENQVEVDGSGLSWNGKTISQRQFNRHVTMARILVPQPRTLLLVHDNASCGQVVLVRARLERELRCTQRQACTEFSEAEWAWRFRDPPPCDERSQAHYRDRQPDETGQPTP